MMNRDLIIGIHIVIREVITMQVQRIVQQLLQVVCPTMHRVRRASLAASVLGALRGRRLTVTAIGRALCGGTSQKHGIKRADRLLSNQHLHAQRGQHSVSCGMPSPGLSDFVGITQGLTLKTGRYCIFHGKAATDSPDEWPISKIPWVGNLSG